MPKLKGKLIELIFILMFSAASVKFNEASAAFNKNEFGDKRINQVEIEDNSDRKSSTSNARTARYYRSTLITDDDEDLSDNGTEYLDFEDDETEHAHLHETVIELELLNSESPATLIEMPESEHSQHRKLLNINDQIETDSLKSKIGSYALPDKYDYPELVHSLKNVYKEMFITSSLYVLNIISAVGIVLVNKFIYSHYNFPHGLVLTLYHFVLTSIGLQVLAGLKMFPIKPVNLFKVLPLSISFCLYVVLTNLSLQYNSGTFYQVSVNPQSYHLFFLDFGGADYCLVTILTLWN